MRPLSALILFALAALCASPAAAALYTYIDHSGARVFTDERPPAGVDYTRVRTSAPSSAQWSPSEAFMFEGPDGRRLATNQRQQDADMHLIATYGRPPARAHCGEHARQALASGGGEFADLILQASEQHGLDPGLVQSVILVESCFDPQAVSRVGAHGLMQLMPATASDLGVTDRFDPEQNIQGGTRYLAAMLDRFDGNLELALAAYNAGPGAVDRHRGVPPFQETRNYIQRIRAQYSGTGVATP